MANQSISVIDFDRGRLRAPVGGRCGICGSLQRSLAKPSAIEVDHADALVAIEQNVVRIQVRMINAVTVEACYRGPDGPQVLSGTGPRASAALSDCASGMRCVMRSHR